MTLPRGRTQRNQIERYINRFKQFRGIAAH